MDIDDLKRKIRSLKKLELKIRDLNSNTKSSLIWDEYFSNDIYDETVKYPLFKMSYMDRDKRKNIIEEYIYHIYYKKMEDTGISYQSFYEPEFLSFLDLPTGSSIIDIKHRFRKLVKKYHPDHGGSGEQIIRLLEMYSKAFP